jgi:micrococcal nuclease
MSRFMRHLPAQRWILQPATVFPLAGILAIALIISTTSGVAPRPSPSPLAYDSRNTASLPPATLFASAMKPLISVEVIRVIDGDTVEVRAQIWLDQYVTTRVRLRGIDAPERRATCPVEARQAVASTEHLAGLLAKGPLYLADISRDKYGGRVLGNLIDADGQNIGTRMLTAGHARAYDGRRRASWC